MTTTKQMKTLPSPNVATIESSVPAYILRPYWQCRKCLFVTHDPRWTRPEFRICRRCQLPRSSVYTWPGVSGDVYHAVLSQLGKQVDWVSTALRAVVLCSLDDVHRSRLMWAVFVRNGVPKQTAACMEEFTEKNYTELFGGLVGKKWREFLQSETTRCFQKSLSLVRKFRNDFIHKRPESADMEVQAIPSTLGKEIHSVIEDIEPAYLEITNNVLFHLDEVRQQRNRGKKKIRRI